MFPKDHEAAVGRAHGPRRRHLRRTLIVAVSASLLGATAITTSVEAANDGSGAAATSHAAKRSTAGLLQAAPATVTGAATDGTTLDNGQFTLRHFAQRGGTLYAVGHLTGTMGHKHVNKTVELPVQSANNNAPGQGLTAPHGLSAPAQTTGACSILNLDLGPLDLNLLGLHVHLNEVVLLIEAIPGAGNLLGNLLCSVANLLNGGLLGGQLSNLLGAITNLLNGLLGGL